MVINSIYKKCKAMGMKAMTQGVNTDSEEKRAKDLEKELAAKKEN